MTKTDESGWAQREIVPRYIPANPRCPDCKTGTMFHPDHAGQRCWVVEIGGEHCKCEGAPK